MTQESLGDPEQAALVIMDNFKGQVTPAINELLEANTIQVCPLPSNTTELLQPMDIDANKPARLSKAKIRTLLQ